MPADGRWLDGVAVRVGNVAISPAEIEGRFLVEHASGEMCGRESPTGEGCCGFIAGHDHGHILCARELIDESGPFALLPLEG